MATGNVTLTEEQIKKLQEDKECVSDFKRDKLERESKKNWDLFYKRNSTHFFKDRHWICREFPELDRAMTQTEEPRPVLFEAGCGVGNAVIPLLESKPNLFIYACDFSPVAIELLKSEPLYNERHCIAFESDLTKDTLTQWIPPLSVDMTLLLFVLSTISPGKMADVLTSIYKVLKPGGLIFFRDYGLYDHAMLRFSKGHKISDHFYFRQDFTRAYYFSKEEVNELFANNGYEVIENQYAERENFNYKDGGTAKRIFVQGKFRKCYQ